MIILWQVSDADGAAGGAGVAGAPSAAEAAPAASSRAAGKQPMRSSCSKNALGKRRVSEGGGNGGGARTVSGDGVGGVGGDGGGGVEPVHSMGGPGSAGVVVLTEPCLRTLLTFVHAHLQAEIPLPPPLLSLLGISSESGAGKDGDSAPLLVAEVQAVLAKGTRCWYTRNGDKLLATVLNVHYDVSATVMPPRTCRTPRMHMHIPRTAHSTVRLLKPLPLLLRRVATSPQPVCHLRTSRHTTPSHSTAPNAPRCAATSPR
jgi:hypothetical protein